ncbi:homeobox-leucine zipper protein ROC6 [Sorghum bicolor]|uniref:homeobox-leucine zipper protein ROC6 n=1 Tax=Sorghum bicolor TaxID=4558 RepID=UPI000B424B11|nr:homeobox-leucine zipper protein ROC6 [Sorghum bicolor]|eukprot:XP_021318696.1 homeobox-leucine zipper protein ROC6 [Sorghum bicolor]
MAAWTLVLETAVGSSPSAVKTCVLVSPRAHTRHGDAGLVTMENERQQNNKGDDELIYLPLDVEEYDMDALMGEEDHLNNDKATGGEEHNINNGSSSKRSKRFNVEQLQQLESSFQECTHPDDAMRRELAARVGIETRQVKFWFQNRRTQTKVKSYATENNKFRQQNADLLAENMELHKELTCSRCRDPTAEKWQLLDENAKLKEMCQRANADLTKLIQAADRPPSVTPEDLALVTSMNPLSSNVGNSSSSTNNLQVTLLSYAECAIKEFDILARNGPPLWLPIIGGNMLNIQEYTRLRFPRLHGICPQGFVVEATRDTALVRGTASDLLGILTNVPRWFETFPGIVAAVRDYHNVSSGIFGSGNGLIQEINVDLSVESPCPPLRSMKFLRISMQTANGDFAVVDVSINGVHEQEAGSKNKHTSCRLLPSGCLIQDMGDGHCQVTWIVHAEYNETIVPPIFRQFFGSGQAFGASRWLASLKRHCEYKAVMHSSQVPTGGGLGVVTISALGRWNLLDLAQRMMAIFYKTTSAMATVEPGTIVTMFGGRRGSAGEMVEPAVRMEHLQSMFSTTYAMGNAVVTNAANNTALLLQQESIDVSCALVVFSLVEKTMIHSIMGGGHSTSSFVLLPSGFAILPDGHGRPHHAAANSSSSALAGPNNRTPPGCLLTAAYQVQVSFNNLGHPDVQGTFEDAGMRICQAIKKIMAAVGTDLVVPA